MKIKEILSQSRRDFQAIYVCEHCNHEYQASGYDDANFHQNVIPGFECPKCKKRAGDNYRGLSPKYPEHFVV